MGVIVLGTSSSVHLRSLTGLRFFAALGVVVYHLAEQFDALNRFEVVTGFGYTGVSFFFILSGFVLAWSHHDGVPAREFYWRRFARVWPLHAVTTILALVVALSLGGTINWRSLPLVAALAHAWVPAVGTYFAFNAVSWSLSAEAFFYLLFPLLFVLLRKRGQVWMSAAIAFISMCVVGSGVAALMSRHWVDFLLYIFPAYRVGEFIVGICLALAIKRGWRPFFNLKQAIAATAFGYMGLVGAAASINIAPTNLPTFIADLWLAPGFAAIILAAAWSDLHGREGLALTRSATVVKLGQWSFALYLIHHLVFQLADPILGKSGLIFAGVGGVLLVAVAIGLSGVLYEFVERPAERKLRGLLSKPATATPSPAV